MSNRHDGVNMDRIKASIIDSFTDFISIANTDREIIYYNPAAYKMMGYSPSERPDIWTTEKLHAEGFDEFAKTTIQPSVFKNGSWKGISAIRHKSGNTIVVEMTVFPLYGADGEEYGTVAVMRDVNELTKMNERLQKSMELFQKVMDSVKVGIVLINMENNTIEMVNKFAEDLLQMNAEEVKGQKCYEVLCHSSLEFCPHVNEKDKPVLLSERYLQRKDGTRIPIIKTGTWITIDSKEYLVDTFVDITIQKELENNLNEAKIAAEAASRSKSEFLSRMSHEMRTPLNAVIGMAQISEKVNEAAKLKECIDTIKLSSTHLLSLINDILDLSKIEEGKLELNEEAFSVSSMIEKIAILIEPKAKEKGIALAVNADSSIPPYLVGDALRLTQVLLNFLSNAVKFSPENSRITFEVRPEPASDGKARLRFSVSDQGIGISEEQLARLFSPFVQADGSITRKYGGTGLGLVISKRLINLMGADIDVTSNPGEGSTFSFAVSFETAAEGDLKTEDMVQGDITGIFKGKKALVVDDVELNRLIAMELMAETGLEFAEASDGRQAVEMATATLYDIILMDVQMPVMDGYEATRLIRQGAYPYSATPIIAMSANVFKEDMERSAAEGMNAHIGKPVDIGIMISTVNRLINHVADGDAVKKAGIAAFKTNIVLEERDKNYFNYELAMEAFGNNTRALAILCDEFIRSDYWGKLKTAMNSRDNAASESILEVLIQKARQCALPSLSSYANLVKETLEKKSYDYALMYLNDLGKCYARTCEVISGLLEE